MRSDVSGQPPGERPAGTDESSELVAPANIRAIFRVGNEFFLRGLDSMARMAGDDLVLALVFNAMWTANVLHITNSAANIEYGGMEKIPPDSMRRPVTVLALASSLRIPYETTRRAAQTLIKGGICVRVGGRGLIVPASVHVQQDRLNAVREALPSLLRFLSDLKRAEFDFEPYRRALPQTVPLPADGTLPLNARAILRVCSEFMMRGVDTLGSVHGDDFLAALIFTAIWTANVRHITGSSENLAFGSLGELPPDEMRRPVPVNAIAQSLRLSPETTRRYAAKLLREGSAIRIEGKGLIIPRRHLVNPANYDGVRQSYTHMVRAVADMHRAGFDFQKY
jgi:DNA-binding transcriptional regulator YhcF (GntR family)